MGRTGRWWAYQHEDAAPDIMTVAKALGGGVPIGAILAAPRADVFEPGDHGSTFGGGPLACAAAVAVMQAVESEGLVEHAAEVGDYLAESLSALADRGAPIAGCAAGPDAGDRAEPRRSPATSSPPRWTRD